MPRTPEQQQQLDESLIWAVENDAEVQVESLLANGASPNAFCERRQVPVIWLVQIRDRQNDDHPILEKLIRAGADTDFARESDGSTVLHAIALKGAPGPARQVMYTGMDITATNHDGLNAAEAARAAGVIFAVSDIEEELVSPRLPIDETLTKEALLEYSGSVKRAPLRHPMMLTRFNDIVAQLEANGEPPLTKADLLRTVQESSGASFLVKATHVGVIGEVIRYLDARDESLTPKDLTAGTAQLIKHMQDCGHLQELFDLDRWSGSDPREFQEFTRALPEQYRDGGGRYNQVLLTLKRDQRLSARERGSEPEL